MKHLETGKDDFFIFRKCLLKYEHMFAIMGAKDMNICLGRMIFLIDATPAFLSWETVYRLAHRGGTLDLRDVPAAVGRDVTLRHGIILEKSIPAKNCGVKTGQSVPEAKKAVT